MFRREAVRRESISSDSLPRQGSILGCTSPGPWIASLFDSRKVPTRRLHVPLQGGELASISRLCPGSSPVPCTCRSQNRSRSKLKMVECGLHFCLLAACRHVYNLRRSSPLHWSRLRPTSSPYRARHTLLQFARFPHRVGEALGAKHRTNASPFLSLHSPFPSLPLPLPFPSLPFPSDSIPFHQICESRSMSAMVRPI